MKKVILAVAVLMGFAATGYTAANIPTGIDAAGQLNTQPIDVRLLGCTPCRAEGTTSAVSCASGSGILYSLEVFGTGAVAGDYSQAFDTSVSGTVAFTLLGRAVSPVVYGTGSANNQVGNIGAWNPALPHRFSNGLFLLNKTVTSNSIACYRLDTGTNP